MKRTFNAQAGMSLVEATIILLVLMLLTGVLAPSIWDFVVDAKTVKVKEDCEAIGVSVVRLARDIGPCFMFDGTRDCTGDNRVDVLYSRGRFGGFDWPVPGEGSWDEMDNQFVTNFHAGNQIYPLPMWRGAYLSSPIGPDPWGGAYAVNSRFLGEEHILFPEAPIVAGSGDSTGMMCGTPGEDGTVDVICLSGGPNQKYETSFYGDGVGGTIRNGDDFVYVIAGSKFAFH
jgi:hypothetical protein